MQRPLLPAIAAALALVAFVGVERVRSAGPAFVDLDVVVSDNEGHPVRGLHQDDFEIREDGRPVTILTADEVTPATASRTMVLVLDDITVVGGTFGMQNIARAFLSQADARDRIAVIRLSHRNDELAGDMNEAIARIDGYVAGAYPFAGRETVQNWLRLVTRLSRQLEPEDGRKTIVALGSPDVLDFIEPTDRTKSLVWPEWVDALSAAARAGVAVYVVDPSGINGSRRVRSDGLVEKTGGLHFGTNDFLRASNLIWDEAGHYYSVSYVPDTDTRELHAIEVKVKPRGAHARARRARGE